MKTIPPRPLKGSPFPALFCLLCLTGPFPAGTAWAQGGPGSTYAITTVAGVASGSADGTGAAARFFLPSAVAADSSGNLYVADSQNQTIRKITPSGVVTTVAGSVQAVGTADGTGSSARFDGPSGIAVDSSGNIYVADTGGSVIREISPGGSVTTIAGLASSTGTADGTGSSARFFNPKGMAADASGNLYVSDYDGTKVRKIAKGGVVTTLAGSGNTGSADGPGAAAEFGSICGVAVDGSGNVYVADEGNETIRMITPAGVVSTLAGKTTTRGSADGTGSAALFSHPTGVSVDGSGNVYVVDSGNSTIRKVTPAGAVTTLAGTAGSIGSADGTAGAAQFNAPTMEAIDAAGNIVVADTGNDTIRKVTPGGVVTTIAGTASPGSSDGTGGAARFNNPNTVAVDGLGNMYVADTGNNLIRKITPAGVVTSLAGAPGVAGSTDGAGILARFSSPYGVAVDASGNVYVADAGNDTIRKVTPAGVVTTLAGAPGKAGSADGTGAAAAFNYPEGVSLDGAGNIYVADTGNQTIRKITPAGLVTTLAGSAGKAGYVDATGSAAQFNQPSGIATDASGNLYVADFNNGTVRKVTPGGVVTSVVISGTIPYIAGVAVDASGNVYAALLGEIVEVSSGGGLTTLAGQELVYGGADGVGSAAQFSNPRGLALDASYNLYVADTNNNTVRTGRQSSLPPTSQTARLVNLSVRADAGAGSQTLIGGYVIAGSGQKSVLVRADGPALSAFGVSGFLADPELLQFGSGSVQIASNAGWGGSSLLDGVFSQVGAFGLASSSKDSAILSTLGPGAYTANVTSVSGNSGVVLLEFYDADQGTPTSRFTNVSARCVSGAGTQTLIAGFAISGIGTETLVIRGDGPALTQFGVTGALVAPVLTLFDSSGAVVATNSGWSNPANRGSSTVNSVIFPASHAVFSKVGAFPLQSGSADCALVATLPPGSYTVQVSGANGATGVALVEVYEVP